MSAQVQKNYLETYHQPHISIYLPIYGYWKESEMTTSVKQDILQKISQAKVNGDGNAKKLAAREVVNMLEVLNLYKSEGKIRGWLTWATCIAVYCVGLNLLSPFLIFGAIGVWIVTGFAKASTFSQMEDNEDLISARRKEVQEDRPIDFDAVLIGMK